MAPIKEATLNAMAFARSLLGAERTEGLQLEEIESASEGGIEVWRITVSMLDSNPGGVLALLSGRREYKIFSVVKATGEVVSMKIWADRINSESRHDAPTTMASREDPVDTLTEAEEDQIRRVLAATGGNKSKAAQVLGIERKTLYRKLERMKL